MTARMLTCWIVSGSLALLVGCDLLEPRGETTEQEDIVVESYQVAGEPLASVRLSESAPLDETYDFSEQALSGAEVAIERLEEDGTVAERYAYRERPDTVGVYEAEDSSVAVEPLGTYRLDVRLPDTDETVTATTVVPDTFQVTDVSATEVVYQGDDQIEYTVTPSAYPGRDQAFFIFSTEAQEVDKENLTPFFREGFERGEVELDEFRVTSSPILNESSYEVDEETGRIRIQLPWISIAFYGLNRTRASAIDDNLFDFVRTQGAQQGGAGLTPGSIPNVIDHVDGGTGVFGSMAEQAQDVQILPPDAPD